MFDQPVKNVLIIFDDREIAFGEVRSLVGARRFGEITFKRRLLIDHFVTALPAWARARLIHLRSDIDLSLLRTTIEASGEDAAACVIASRTGFVDSERLTQLLERLPYAEEDFTDRLYKPLLVFMRDAHFLIKEWADFQLSPLHKWERAWQGCQRLKSIEPLDLAQIRDFLLFTSGSTATRHFNQIEVDAYYYTKRSSDKQKMLAEYSFCNLVPESMRPWLIQTFDYRDEGDRASYKMLRYYLADAALQWVHGAFEADTFSPFVERLLFFLSERPRRSCSREESLRDARKLFVTKLEERVKQFLDLEEGRRINSLASSSSPAFDLRHLFDRYLRLYERYEKGFAFDHLVVGHGDPCFSNVLYDQQRYLLKLIDPKGAVTKNDLWVHPLYDLCKISHSALGDYDFINNGLYSIGFTDKNELKLGICHTNHDVLKPLFLRAIKTKNYDIRVMRLGEASLFLSMLPLHIDHPNKVIAFMLKASQILEEVEFGIEI